MELPEQYATAAQVASYLGCHYRTIENWAAQGLIESNGDGYGLHSAFKYQIAKLQSEMEKFEEARDDIRSALFQADFRIKNAQADLKEMERDRQKGLLVEISQVTEEWEMLIFKCRSKLLSLPSKLALELSGLEDPIEIEQKLQEIIDEALQELSNG